MDTRRGLLAGVMNEWVHCRANIRESREDVLILPIQNAKEHIFNQTNEHGKNIPVCKKVLLSFVHWWQNQTNSLEVTVTGSLKI